MSKVEIDVTMPPELYQRLLKFADSQNLSPEAAAEQLIERYIQHFYERHQNTELLFFTFSDRSDEGVKH